MATISLDQFIDKHADSIDSQNTYDLLFYANMELSDEDLSTLTKELAKLGLNMLEHLKKDYDEVRLFADDFTIEDFQKYLDKNFSLNSDIKEYFKYNLDDMFQLLEDKASDLGISFGQTNMEPFEYIDEYLDNIKITVHVEEDTYFMLITFATRTGLKYQVFSDLDTKSFAFNSSVGYGLNRDILRDELAGMSDTLKDFFKAHLD